MAPPFFCLFTSVELYFASKTYLELGSAHSIKVTSPPCREHANTRRLIMPKVVYTSQKGLVQSAGSGVNLSGNTLQGNLRPVRSVVAADSANGITFGPSDCGVIVSLAATTGGVAITLPTATTAGAGWYCDIVYAANTPGGDVTVTGGTFKLICVDGGAATEAPDSGTTLTLATASSVAGDRVRILCDGSLYYAMGASSAGTNITAA